MLSFQPPADTSLAERALTFRAPAKVNLALHVTGRRADGYHLLESLVVFTGCGDRVTATAADADDFHIHGPFAPAVPADASNLVLRARDLLRRAFPQAATGPVRIALEKNLPAASGIGGGSSDAAAALRALSALWTLDPGADALGRLATPLGADLPMCVAARPLIARGIGEEIEPVDDVPPLVLLLVNPGVPVATPEVFRRLARHDNPPLPPLPRQPGMAGLLGWLAATRNDLEVPGAEVAPVVLDALAALRANGAALARMSGSGATCFGLFSRLDEASAAARRIARAQPGWWVAATQAAAAQAMEAENART